MATLNKARKSDLLSLRDDLGLVVPENLKVTDLIKLIKESECYHEELSKDWLEAISCERKERLQIEEGKLQAEKEERKFMTYVEGNRLQVEAEREFELKTLEL